jgi:hypothetical protein
MKSDHLNTAAVIDSAITTATAAQSTAVNKKDAPNRTKLNSKNNSEKDLKLASKNNLDIQLANSNQTQPSPKTGKKIRESLQPPPSPLTHQSPAPSESPKKVNSPRPLNQSDYQLDYIPQPGLDKVYFFNSTLAANPNSPQQPVDSAKKVKIPKEPYELDGDEIFLEKIYHGLAKKTAKGSSSSGGNVSQSKKNVKSPVLRTPSSQTNTKTKSEVANPSSYVPSNGVLVDPNEGQAFDPDRRSPECALF